jgi:3-phenylpropionate/trans-cinnamate dioxygenase alpha subunit
MAPSGDALDSLVDWERGLISPEIFWSSEVYERELERIFLRTWQFLAHESQFQKPGDFFQTFIGNDPVLVVGQADRSVKAFINSCRHRGMKVCRADSGNSRAFTCTYHGWSYDIAGKLINVPSHADAYYGELEMEQWGLVPVPRIETYKGLVFGNFDEGAPSLLEYLGDMAWYLDALLDRREGGTEFLGGVHKIRHQGNWKFAAEQFAGDTYHALITHASAFEATADPTAAKRLNLATEARQYSSRAGHGLAGFADGDNTLSIDRMRALSRDHQLVADYYASTTAEVIDRLGKERAGALAFGAATVFPNLSYLNGTIANSSIGVFLPKGPNDFENWRFGIVDRAAPPEVKQAMARNMHVWPLGLADADDGENWSTMGTNMKGVMVRRTKLNYQMGVGHERDDDPKYPGRIGSQYYGEGPQRGYYRRWLDFMTSDAWPRLTPQAATA